MPEQKRVPQITDPTGLTVASNIRQHRERQGMSTYELARRLSEAGRPMTPAAVGRVERAERRVDVGDLMAVAIALDVPPITLLLPANLRAGVEITGTGLIDAGTGQVSGRRAWAWAQGREPLRYPAGADDQTRARHLALWLMTVTPEGLDHIDLSTRAGQQSFVDAVREWMETGGEGASDG